MRFQSTVARLGFRALVILLATGFSLLLFTISIPWFGVDFMPQLHLDSASIYRGYIHQLAKVTISSHAKLTNKVLSYRQNGEHEKAVAVYKEILQITSNRLGPEHVVTVETLEILAELAVLAKKLDEGISIYWQVYRIKEKTLGPTHLDTITTLQKLAEVYHNKGNYKKAADFSKVVYKQRKTVLGLDHVETMEALLLFGGSLWKADQSPEMVEKVLNYFRQVQKVYSQTSGKAEETLVVLLNIGNCLVVLERFEEALPVLRTVMETTEKIPQSKLFEMAENFLSFALTKLGRSKEVRQLYKTAHQIKGKSGEGIPEYDSIIHGDGKFTPALEDEISAALNLARVAHAQKNFKNALRQLEKIQSEIGKDHPKAKEVFYSLMKAHGALRNFKKAFEMSIEHFKAVQKQFYGESSEYNQNIIHTWETAFVFYMVVSELHPNEEEELFRPKLKEISEILVNALEEELELELELEVEFRKGDRENSYLLKTVAMAASLAGKREMSIFSASKLLEILKRARKANPKPSQQEMEKINQDFVFFQKIKNGNPFCESPEKCEVPNHIHELELK